MTGCRVNYFEILRVKDSREIVNLGLMMANTDHQDVHVILSELLFLRRFKRELPSITI